jgi:anti-repressor protein
MARRYFIECEKRLKQIQAEPDSYMIDDPVKRAQRWIVEKQELIAAKEELKEKDEVIALQAPKVALYDTAMSAKNNFTMERVAKTIGYGRNKLFEFLREKKILRDNNLPYEEYRKRGYFDVRQYSITHLTSGIENKTQTLVTPKGMSYIHKMLVDNGKIS